MKYTIRYNKTEVYRSEITVEVQSEEEGKKLAQLAADVANEQGSDDALFEEVRSHVKVISAQENLPSCRFELLS